MIDAYTFKCRVEVGILMINYFESKICDAKFWLDDLDIDYTISSGWISRYFYIKASGSKEDCQTFEIYIKNIIRKLS